MTLSRQQRETLYAHVANLFSESMHDARDPYTVAAFMGEIASVTHQATSDVVEKWNQKAHTVLYRLPMELLAHSFSWLDPPERVKVTAVSRYLRSVALGDPSLWAQIKFEKKHSHRNGALALLLERSGSATLDVDIHALIPGIEDVLLAQHVRRLRTLILDNTDTVLVAITVMGTAIAPIAIILYVRSA
ncbi:hypothetical protein EXIGLDRAFT_697314 [Exidia glandulosa HHB12029]|uniref:F-box domain-containing protein n=1 Tax=Exidia glandulosa HHB12029 TaxID=1314781 RepID=A0A165EU34_EXIGL|nr:hypothetical protein EXIGLDRAFT_697314 [Exidia glandulosa HHB12029]